jgi:bifunctional UDP-N-acetylglucosamine pyrophosphorylase/glucosamine-1-phosphate N-acetyltransferase
MTLAVVILAAGKSTRFKSKIPKVLHDFGERPMIEHLLDTASELTDMRPVLVVGEETEGPLSDWAGDRARFVFQEQRLGTGHAVLQARETLEGEADVVLAVYGDMPLLRAETLRQLVELREAEDAAMAMLTVVHEDPMGFGRVIRAENGDVLRVVEEPEATPAQLKIQELNAGVYAFDAEFLWATLPKIEPSAEKGEIYLPDTIGMATEEGRRVVDLVLDDPTEAMGINTRVNFAAALAVLRRRINEGWMLEGVTIIDPASTYIGPEVTIGQDTVILPNTHLRGRTAVGTDCEIGPNSVLDNSIVGDRCRVTASVLEEAEMESDSDIGPFSHLRRGAKVCTGAHVGNFGEMKNSTLGPDAKMGHFSYLGDATVGTNVNIGAGTITCNYDGQRKHPTTIEDDVFIGSDSLLVAPIHIGKGAKTGAGSVVTHDVAAHTLAYGVPARPKRSLDAADLEESSETRSEKDD